jgi:hypothetical protein
MEKIKQDCDSLIRDVNRKFITPETITVGMDLGESPEASEEEVTAEGE